jgi:MFS family permease
MMPGEIFRALRYRNFRLFFSGQSISLVGTWMQAIAMSWLVYRLTNSPLLLGLVGFSSQIPTFILGPFAGVIADRFSRHRILIFTQTIAMLQAFILAFLTLSGRINVWEVVALGFFLGCVNSLDIPARQAFIVEMVEGKEDLSNGLCFLVNGISFTAVIISLLAMTIRKTAAKSDGANILKELAEGFNYAYGFIPIRYILLLLSVVSLTGMSYVVLMPVFARDVLHGGPGTFGFLMASAGIGALCATAYLASRKTVLGLARNIPLYSSIFSVAMIVFSLSRNLWFSLVALAVAGFGLMSHMASSNIILQTIVDDDKRGRVMSLYAMAFIGMAPFGSLLAGALAARIGATNTLVFGGIVCIFSSFLYARKRPLLRKYMHPVYKKMGIIPEIATGIGAVTRLSTPPED